MECPECGLISPASAQRCDCGFDFQTGKIKESYLPAPREDPVKARERVKSSYMHIALGVFLLLLGGIGLIVCIKENHRGLTDIGFTASIFAIMAGLLEIVLGSVGLKKLPK